MSNMTDAIKELSDNGETIKVYIPGKGYVLGKVDQFEDDVVTIKPNRGNKVVIHYTQFSVERD